jgi:hypothetical protein
MLSNKEVEKLISKIDLGVKLGVQKALEKIKYSENPTIPVQQNGKIEWINLKETKS